MIAPDRAAEAASEIKPTTLSELSTPCLVLDASKLDRNLRRLRDRCKTLGVALRPHLKTAKSVEVARLAMTSDQGPATVSTLKEARVFADAGVTDILYAVGIAPSKLAEIIALQRGGVDITVVLDSEEQAIAVARASKAAGLSIPALIEIDCDGHRSGVRPDNIVALRRIGQALVDGGATLRGVVTHAGESYNARSKAALEAAAEQERAAAVLAATALRDAGLPCPVVSVGSTPTAHFARNLEGVTEVRAGVYMFFDLVMRGIGVCDTDDIALSVLTTVIGRQDDKNWIIVDAGWMAMSRDRGTAKQAIDCGYGLVCDASGNLIEDLMVIDANQEHGIIAPRPGSNRVLPAVNLGDQFRILPNHACATGAQHDRYNVVEGSSDVVQATFSRFSGW